MSSGEILSFAGGGLERAAHLRKDEAALWSRPDARVLPLWHGRPLVGPGGAGDAAEAVLLPVGHPLLDEATGPRVFLGQARALGHGAPPIFAVDVSGWTPPEETDAEDPGPGRAGDDQPVTGFEGLPDGARFADMRSLLAELGAFDAALVATGKSLLEWHRSHAFCAACGAASTAAEAGWRRDCPSCGRTHFPRTDPVVIMLVTHDNALLLGRSPGWPEGMYSLLAGFVEPGETIEDAVRREVAEESAVPVGKVDILSSQPWPWPSSLMIGCSGEALSREITLDPVELEDAIWLTREELLAAFAGTHPKVRPPRPGAIARHLMHGWLSDRMD